MGGKVLERKHVAGGQGDDGIGIAGSNEFAESLEDGDEVLDGAVVADYEDQWALGPALQQGEQQGFGGGRESGYTHAPRALFQVGGCTREGGKSFNVRKEFADEGKKHAGLF